MSLLHVHKFPFERCSSKSKSGTSSVINLMSFSLLSIPIYGDSLYMAFLYYGIVIEQTVWICRPAYTRLLLSCCVLLLLVSKLVVVIPSRCKLNLSKLVKFIWKSHSSNVTLTTYIVEQQASMHNMQVIANVNVFVWQLNKMFTELCWYSFNLRYGFRHVSSFSHMLLLLVKVSLVMFLYYGLYVDMPLPLSQLVSFGSNSEQY